MNQFILPVVLLLVAAAIFAVDFFFDLDALWEKVRPRKIPLPPNETDPVEAVVEFEEIFGFPPEEFIVSLNVNRAAARLVVLQIDKPKEYVRALQLLRYWAPHREWERLASQEAEAIAKKLKERAEAEALEAETRLDRQKVALSKPPEHGLEFITFPSNPNDE